MVEIACNTAVDAGLYTFTFAKTGAVVSGRYSYTDRWDGSLSGAHYQPSLLRDAREEVGVGVEPGVPADAKSFAFGIR